MSRTLFISDLHLTSSRPAQTRALAGFLAAASDCDALYILGDLFEAWPGDDDDSPLADEVAAMLGQFSATGASLFLMQGNRDFLLGESFCKRVGAKLLADPTRVELYGESTLLLHGDSLCTADSDYQAFRKTARDPAWQSRLLARDLDERRGIAARLRSMSREANSNKAEDIMDVTPAEVDKVMREYGVRQLIHGHTHRPGCHESPAGTRWVLGDWGARGWAIEASRNDFKLYDFFIKQ